MDYKLTQTQKTTLESSLLSTFSRALDFGYEEDGFYILEGWVIDRVRLDIDIDSIFDFSTADEFIKVSEESEVNIPTTGWATYVDTQYTESSPFKLYNQVKVTLPNNAGFIIDNQKPLDIDTFYNNVDLSITGRNKDAILITIEFLVIPRDNNSSLKTSIDIGGSIGEIYPRLSTFPKKKNVGHPVSMSISGYTLDTWEANGGKVKIISEGDIDIYNIRYVITRTHKAI